MSVRLSKYWLIVVFLFYNFSKLMWLIVVSFRSTEAMGKRADANENFASRAGCSYPGKEDEEDEDEFEDMMENTDALLENEYEEPCKPMTVTKKQKIAYVAAATKSTGMVEMSAGAMDDNPEFFSSKGTVCLPMVGYCWKDQSLRKLITVVVNLPSGLVNKKNSSLVGRVQPHLTDGNTKLVLQVEWPECMTNDLVLAQAVARSKTCPAGSISVATCLQGFREAVARHGKSSHAIGSDIHIALPHEVEGIEEFLPVCCGDTTGYNLIIILKVKSQETHEEQYNMEFQVVRKEDNKRKVRQV